MLELIPPARWYRYFSQADRHPFSGSAPVCDGPNAWWLAEMSLLAYADAAFVAARLRPAGFELGLFGDAGSTQFFVAHGLAASIVAFRGTEVSDLGQFAEDVAVLLQAQPVRLPSGGLVPGGMQQAVEEVWPQVDRAIGRGTGRGGDGDRPVWFTGHSLGGALAVLAGLRHREAHGHMPRVCTFGAPPMGSGDLLAGSPERVCRFVHGADLVPRLPPVLYQPVGRLQFIQPGGRVGVTDELPGFPGPRATPTEWIEAVIRTFGPQCLLDHSPVRYANALQEVLTRL